MGSGEIRTSGTGGAPAEQNTRRLRRAGWEQGSPGASVRQETSDSDLSSPGRGLKQAGGTSAVPMGMDGPPVPTV